MRYTCRTVLAEQLPLKAQAQIIGKSNLVFKNDGAAMGNIMLMAPVGKSHLASLFSDTLAQADLQLHRSTDCQ